MQVTSENTEIEIMIEPGTRKTYVKCYTKDGKLVLEVSRDEWEI